MRATTFVQLALSAAAAVCLVVPIVETGTSAPVVVRSDVVLAVETVSEPGPVQRLEIDAAVTPIKPIDIANAIGAGAYLAVAGPLLVVSIPLQLLSGQSAAVTTSLNNLITAANTILKLVGRSIPLIPTASRAEPAVADSTGSTRDPEQDRDAGPDSKELSEASEETEPTEVDTDRPGGEPDGGTDRGTEPKAEPATAEPAKREPNTRKSASGADADGDE